MTAAFLSPLRVEQIGERTWLLIDDLVFRSDALRGELVAPRGFQTDFASIPRVAWIWFRPVDRYNAAATMHDAAYANALMTPGGLHVFLIKQLADDLFEECLTVLGVEGVRRRIMVSAVRDHGDPLGHPLSAHYTGVTNG